MHRKSAARGDSDFRYPPGGYYCGIFYHHNKVPRRGDILTADPEQLVYLIDQMQATIRERESTIKLQQQIIEDLRAEYKAAIRAKEY